MKNFKKEVRTYENEYILNVSYSYSDAYIEITIRNKMTYLLAKYSFNMCHYDIIAYCVEAVSKYEDSLITSDNEFVQWDGDMRRYLSR